MDVSSSLQIHTTPSSLIPDQVPTPPPSEPSTPTLTAYVPASQEDEDVPGSNVFILISKIFHPHSKALPPQPDTIFSSSDNVFFYVHRAIIQEKSLNGWNERLPRLPASSFTDQGGGGTSKVISFPETATVLNIVLHAVYGLPCAAFNPSIDDLSAAVDAMATYGIPPKEHILPATPLYVLILNHAPLHPLAAYTLAGCHDLHSLAVPISTHLLSYPLSSLTEATAQKMGPVYLKRLFCLHTRRIDMFKRLLPPPPLSHAPTDVCRSAEQTRLTRGWTLTSAQLAWNACPDLSSDAIEAAFLPLAKQLSCPLCTERLAARVRQVVAGWSTVKRSI